MALCPQIQLSTIQLRSPGFLWRVVINLGSGFIQGVKDSKWSEKKPLYKVRDVSYKTLGNLNTV